MPGSSSRYLVMAPAPGPTSNTCSSCFTGKDDTMSLQIFSSFRKCCPSDFLSVYIRLRNYVISNKRQGRQFFWRVLQGFALTPDYYRIFAHYSQTSMSTIHTNKPVIGITVGDINSIGAEIIIKTFADN